MYPMPFEKLRYSTTEVDIAGEVLRNKKRSSHEDLVQAYIVIDNWRAAHYFPLNTFQIFLKDKATRADADALIAIRIKRLASIEQKLRLMRRLTLSQMQDIGGCRAVVASVEKVDELASVYKRSRLGHELVKIDDYIRLPKKTGYRSLHLIYRYHTDKGGKPWNDRQIEIQLRSRLQHSWATAVETVGTFTRQALKSNLGRQDWLRFFQLMGTVMALEEGTPPVPNTPNDPRELVRELRVCSDSLQVGARLAAYGSALSQIGKPKQREGRQLYLLSLDPSAQTVTVKGYKWSEVDKALKEYSETEQVVQSLPGGEAVLVSVASLDALRKAYPNYFLDTQVFRVELANALAGKGVLGNTHS